MMEFFIEILNDFGFFALLIVWVIYDAAKREARMVADMKQLREYIIQLMSNHNIKRRDEDE